MCNVVSACHDAWCHSCSRLLNWCVSWCGVSMPYNGWSDNCSRLLNWCDNISRLLNWCVSWCGICSPWCLVCHLLRITQLACQLMRCLLSMMPGVTAAQDCSTSVSADVASARHDDWCGNCSRLLNWCDNYECAWLLNWCDNCLRLLNWCDNCLGLLNWCDNCLRLLNWCFS